MCEMKGLLRVEGTPSLRLDDFAMDRIRPVRDSDMSHILQSIFHTGPSQKQRTSMAKALAAEESPLRWRRFNTSAVLNTLSQRDNREWDLQVREERGIGDGQGAWRKKLGGEVKT